MTKPAHKDIVNPPGQIVNPVKEDPLTTATHEWTAAKLIGFGYVNQLRYYRPSDTGWEVYSDITGWRKSGNDAKWFEEEAKEGFFVPLVKENK